MNDYWQVLVEYLSEVRELSLYLHQAGSSSVDVMPEFRNQMLFHNNRYLYVLL